MIKTKSALLLTYIFACLIFATGCWNYRDIDKLAIVSGAAIDKSEDGKMYIVTAEIQDFEKYGKEPKTKSKLVSAEGETLFDAVRNIIKISAKKLYWGHTKVIIVSKELANEGISQIVDWILRDAEIRMETYIVVSKELTAKEILMQKSISSEMRSYEIDEMLNSQKSLAKAPKVEAYKFVNELETKGESAVLPTVGIVINDKEKTSELSGMAVFKGDRLVDLLNENDTKMFLFIKNQVKGGVLIGMENPKNTMANITLEIFESRTKIKPEYEDGELCMSVNVEFEVAVGEDGTIEDYIGDEGSRILKRDMEELLKSNIKEFILKVQKEYGTDIFGFGSKVRVDKPSEWKKIENDWENIFRHLKTNVNVTIHIRNTGLISKSIKVGG